MNLRPSSPMRYAVFFQLAAGALLMAFQANPPDTGKLALALRATLNPNHSITCRLTVKNPTQAVVQVSIPGSDPPFMVSIVDQNGRDLNQDAYPPVKRGKSATPPSRQALVTLTLQPGEERQFEATITLPAQEGVAGRLAPGTYKVQARLATVKYIGGKYETTLFHSNQVEILVNN